MIWLLFTLLWSGLLVWVLWVLLTAWVLMRPARLTPARALARLGRISPEDLGLRFESTVFPVRGPADAKSLSLHAWWLAGTGHNATGTVILIHGYADSRLGALPFALPWVNNGWNVLAVDLRAHGESDGTYTTAGLRERDDLSQVIDRLRAERPVQTQQIILMGISMGSAVALATADLRDDVSGVVIDSPVASFPHGARTQLSLMGLAGPIVASPGVWLVELWLGERFASIEPVTLLGRRRCPVLAILPGDDPFLPSDAAIAIRNAVHRSGDSVSQCVDFPLTGHMAAAQSDPQRYVNALNRFGAACKPDGLARAAGGSRPDAPDVEPPCA